MISAAALVKPTITGLESMFTIAPRLRRPSRRRKTPTISASMMESSMKLAEPGFARGISAAADISDSIATGPVWS